MPTLPTKPTNTLTDRLERIMDESGAGICQVVNKTNGKAYIVGAVDTVKCLDEQLVMLSEGRHPSKHLQYAYNKYGGKAFEFKVVKRCEPLEVTTNEQQVIDELGTLDPKKGYNWRAKQ